MFATGLAVSGCSCMRNGEGKLIVNISQTGMMLRSDCCGGCCEGYEAVELFILNRSLAPDIFAQPQVQLVLERMDRHAQYWRYNAGMDWANRAHMRISSILELKSALPRAYPAYPLPRL